MWSTTSSTCILTLPFDERCGYDRYYSHHAEYKADRTLDLRGFLQLSPHLNAYISKQYELLTELNAGKYENEHGTNWGLKWPVDGLQTRSKKARGLKCLALKLLASLEQPVPTFWLFANISVITMQA